MSDYEVKLSKGCTLSWKGATMGLSRNIAVVAVVAFILFKFF